MATNNAMVTPLTHTDVRGKELLYLKIQGASGEVVINIGKATYDGVAKVILPRETSTQINILPPVGPETKK